MHDEPLIFFPPRRLRILLTNDDGVTAEGLHALKRALDPLGELRVIAPDGNRSGAARAVSLRSPLWVEEVDLPGGGCGYATDGTPVDCVRLAALGFLDHPPDLIVAGINHGGNLGDDITYSGTVAAAFEGIMLDTPAIAVSADAYHQGYDLTVPARFTARLVELVVRHGFPTRTLLNVNCPDVSWDALQGARLTRLGKRIYGDRVQLKEDRGRRRRYFIYGDELSYHQEAGTDFEALANGCISITPVHFSLTSHEAFDILAGWDLSLDEGARASDGIVRPAASAGHMVSTEASGSRSAGRARPPSTVLGEAAEGTSVATAEEEVAGVSAPPPEPEQPCAMLDASPLAPQPEAIVFDLDGTVVDSVELIVQSFRYAVRAVLGMELPREEIIRNVGRPLREQMLVLDERRADELVIAFRAYNHREHEKMLRLYPGMAELLLRLRADGVRLGLVTSKSRMTTDMAFSTTGIEPLFDAVVTADDTTRHKPDPEPLILCLRGLERAPEGAVYVGDSPWDLQAAQAAGMRSVAVSWGVFPEETLCRQGPDRLVRSIHELRAVLGLGSVPE
ncbi:MAG: 5'/3'-nucleotidase SurE [Thermoleophilia bacterium]|nr:5'/3'-nucleotidase SurE [Thermoleophilia bacterium]